MLAQQHPVIRKAVAVLKELSTDERLRMQAEAREKLRRDETAMMMDARSEGRAEGKAEGKAEGAAQREREIAQSMLTQKMPIDVIAKVTGLAQSDVLKLSLQES